MDNSTYDHFFSSIEGFVRAASREFIEHLIEEELSQALERLPYGRGGSGYRNGHRERTLGTGAGVMTISVPRGRLKTEDGEREFRSKLLPHCKRLTSGAQALIVASYLCGVSTRKVSLALSQILGPMVSKSTVSRCLESLKPAYEAFLQRDLSQDEIVRLILDGTCIKVRLAGKAERVTILAAIGITKSGQKVLLGLTQMCSESKEAWKELLESLTSRNMAEPKVVIVDGSKGLEAALSEIWPQALVQRCTVHKLRNLLASSPDTLHEELKHDYKEMIYAESSEEVLELREAFITKWRVRCPKVARSLQEAGDRLFTFTRFPVAQWKSLRTTNAIERLNEEFRRRVKVQGVHPSGESVCMLLWALVASGAITLHRVWGWEHLDTPPKDIQLAA